MTLGSSAHGALAELTIDDLDRMLELDETLFVEHKSDLKADSSYNVMKAVASFANTVGGWLLIGVRDGKPLGELGPWALDDGPPLVDQVRDRLRMELDPLTGLRGPRLRASRRTRLRRAHLPVLRHAARRDRHRFGLRPRARRHRRRRPPQATRLRAPRRSRLPGRADP